MTRLTIYVGVLFIFGTAYCLKIVPDRFTTLSWNKDEIENCKTYVSRHGRKSGYYLNLEGNVLNPWHNNVTFHLIFYEYLHNEYRRSFVEMHFKGCEAMINDVYIVGGALRKAGLKCPIFGQYHLLNMTVPAEEFKYKVPFEKVRIDVYINKTNLMIYHGHIYMHFNKI